MTVDVWALGVLLYKLCYYTTPFEEHGPLAILNVQYKIPPYPVYSQGMIGMISTWKMLRIWDDLPLTVLCSVYITRTRHPTSNSI